MKFADTNRQVTTKQSRHELSRPTSDQRNVSKLALGMQSCHQSISRPRNGDHLHFLKVNIVVLCCSSALARSERMQVIYKPKSWGLSIT